MIFLSPPHLLLFSLLLLSSSLHGFQKNKRSILDSRDISTLKKIEEAKARTDRSINIQDEQMSNLKPVRQAGYFANYYNNIVNAPSMAVERRAVDPAQEANSPFITDPYPTAKQQQRVAAPVKEAKRSSIPMPEAPHPARADPDSFPLHLNVRSQNAQLQGAVPHFEEYGETVESVMKAQKAQKRFRIPRPDYSSEIVKKSDIPRPDDDDEDSPLFMIPRRRSKINKPKKGSKRSKTFHKKRQYVQYPQMQQYAYNNNGYANNYMNSGSFFTGQQNGMLQFQQPAAQPAATANIASHVQNLDGAITRPVLTEKACDDQYSLCSEYAKNGYCTNYKPQMEVQCRKSCGFCAPGPVQAAAAARSSDDDEESGSGDDESGSGEADALKKSLPGLKRHDILQERSSVSYTESSDDDLGSGSGSGDGSGSGSGSGSGDSDDVRTVQAPVEAPVYRNPLQEFHLPSKKEETPAESDEESGSGSGSGDESGDSQDSEPAPHKLKLVELPVVAKKAKTVGKPVAAPVAPAPKPVAKRAKVPKRPSQLMFYPKIDLKAIASSLAHYEEAALELAGEYPKLQDTDVTEYTRSFIPHPESTDEIRANRNRQNIQIAKIISSERARKDNIPKFLKVTGDVKKPEATKEDADSLDSVQQRFIVPGVEPTLNDYYAETGKLNPFNKKVKNYKKSRIENDIFSPNFDPYEYLRNMPAGSSMEPIIDPRKKSYIPSDTSYPVFLMKVSPKDEKKYLEEKADRRGKIRHFNAEGVQISEQKFQESHKSGPSMNAMEASTQGVDAAAAAFARSSAPTASISQQLASFNIAQKGLEQAAPAPAPIQPASPPTMDFSQMQQNAAQQASMFPGAEQFSYNAQPGTTDLRSKMLNAFFDTRTNSSPEEGSGMMMGSGDGGLRVRNVV